MHPRYTAHRKRDESFMHRQIAYAAVRASMWIALALFAACGDDGTERLSACPDGRIESDKMGILRCAASKEKKPDAASSGNGSASGSGGSNVATSAAGTGTGNWYCQQVDAACSCVSNPTASDTCVAPRPTCCVEVKHDTAAAQSCVCYSEGSPECSGAKTNPALYTPIPACPPR